MREQGGGSGETRMFKVSSINQLQGCISICLDFSIQVVSNAFENKVEFFYSHFADPQLTVIHRLRCSDIE